MYTLFIDTHFEDVVVILYKDKEIISKEIKNSSYHHSEITMPTIKEVLDSNKLRPNDLGQIVVVNGPGSFTGVRIAVTIAKTLAYTLKIPIKVIDSLLIQAISIDEDKDFYVVLKEKNGVYVGGFDKNDKVISDYKYLNYNEYNEYKIDKNMKEDIEVNYERLINYVDKLNSMNPHSVKPLYIKRIGVSK